MSSDEVLNIKLTSREIDLVLECIGTNIETVKRRHPMTGLAADLVQELAEMDMDIREQAFNRDDWTEDLEPTEISEDHFIQAGIAAREQVKASSRAAERRTLNFSAPTCDGERSETQKHDLWEKPSNDPADW